MGKIRLLPDDVASQVAAGEVVERPSSVIKELFENSIDAGAGRITIEFGRGGTQLMRVTDDGCGMEQDDAILSLERHATSKIRTAGDLAAVTTMGFRGEALPSIASVSRFRLVTRTRGGAAGTRIDVAGGKIESVSESGEAPGTQIEVRALFFNLPARRKFLRGEETEAAHIIQQVQSLAIAHPEVSITLLRDGRRLLQAAASKDTGVRIRDLFGSEFLSRLLPIEALDEGGIRLTGFLAKPGEGRPDRDQQYVILNGRLVHCPAIYQSLREAYAEALPRGRHPLAVLRVDMDPHAFDCNVHPAKREVRLHRPDQLRQAVFQATRRMLDRLKQPGASVRTTFTPPPPVERPDMPPSLPAPSVPAFSPARQLEIESAGKPDAREPAARFRLIGGLENNWILMEGVDGLVILDTRAAKERILFERLRREVSDGRTSSQNLLIPEAVELTPKDAAWVSGNLPALHTSGFHLEPFGGNSFKIEAVPSCLSGQNARDALLELCGMLRSTGSLGSPQALDELIRSVSRLAVPDGRNYSEEASRNLVEELLRCDLPYACPHGRPTMIQWSFSELQRKFGR